MPFRRNPYVSVFRAAILALAAAVPASARSADIPAPLKKTINKIIKPLRYSSWDPVRAGRAKILLDFPREKWTWRNIRTIDKDGEVRLENGVGGTCLELALHTARELETALPNLKIEVWKVRESQYFMSEVDQHFAVVVRRGGPKRDILVDPSFKVVGVIAASRRYLMISRLEGNRLSAPWVEHDLGVGQPFHKVGINILSLAVLPVNGHYDAHNFALEVRALRPHELYSPVLFQVRRRDGAKEILGADDKEVEQDVGEQAMREMRLAVVKLFDSIELLE